MIMQGRPDSKQKVRELNKKFSEIPNLTMRGNTFDVKHLDQFIVFDQKRNQQSLNGSPSDGA